jgi:hypothetical protein
MYNQDGHTQKLVGPSRWFLSLWSENYNNSKIKMVVLESSPPTLVRQESINTTSLLKGMASANIKDLKDEGW